MKTKVFLRIGKYQQRIRVDASLSPKYENLKQTAGRSPAIPTVFMAMELEIPDEAFQPANIFASIKVPIEKLGTAIEVVDPLKVL